MNEEDKSMNEEDIRNKISHLNELKQNHTKRLRALENRHAVLGLNGDVSIEIEIHDISRKLTQCEEEISKCKELLSGPRYEILKVLEQATVMLQDSNVEIREVLRFLSEASETQEMSNSEGSLAGSSLGAVLGSLLFPGFGTIIGGLIGGALGAYFSPTEKIRRFALLRLMADRINTINKEITDIESV